jgi:hypothetical protein
MSSSKIISTIVFSTLLIACLVSSAFSEQGKFTLSSPDIPKKGQMKDAQVFSGFGCSGQNISPALAWKNFPPETKSFALMVHDPDAPTGSGWIEEKHYVATLGPDSIRGVGDAPPYTFALSGLSEPSAAIVSQAAMDDTDGGWAILFGEDPVWPGGLNLAIDED